MPIIIHRKNAIELICKEELNSLTILDRESIILNWWCIDESDIEFHQLSYQLQQKIKKYEIPNDPNNNEYDQLILIALKINYVGVKNDFLEKIMHTKKLGTFKVNGIPKILEVCPCCNYRTLKTQDNFEVCPICYWEDNGIIDLDKYSGPNHMTLGEAKEKFKSSKIDNLDKWIKN